MDLQKSEAKAGTTEEPAAPMKGIPEFWLTSFKNQPTIAELITEKDEDVLKSLTDIKVSYLENNPV